MGEGGCPGGSRGYAANPGGPARTSDGGWGVLQAHGLRMRYAKRFAPQAGDFFGLATNNAIILLKEGLIPSPTHPYDDHIETRRFGYG